MRQDEFGYEHGLMHELIVTGRKAGATRDFYVRLAHDANLFRRVVGMVYEDGSTPVTVEQAAAIMGNNFHGVEATERCFGDVFTAKQKRALTTVPFSAGTLQSHADTHILVAIAPLSLLDVHRSPQNGLFWVGQRRDLGFGRKAEKFAHEKATIGWALFRKTPVPDSTSKTWDEQQKLLSAAEFTPQVAVVTQVMTVHWAETSERLFPNRFDGGWGFSFKDKK